MYIYVYACIHIYKCINPGDAVRSRQAEDITLRDASHKDSKSKGQTQTV